MLYWEKWLHFCACDILSKIVSDCTVDFKDSLQVIDDAINQAEFLAIDAEFSGLFGRCYLFSEDLVIVTI